MALKEIEEDEEADEEGDIDLDKLEEEVVPVRKGRFVKKTETKDIGQLKPTVDTGKPIKRYNPFIQQERIGVVDSMRNDVISEGLTAGEAFMFAEILERLDRIEQQIGRM